uniref:Nitric oxide synthase n=1 Tax=Nautilus pompilius TaxID=34573 RepID=A0A6G5T779_9MOLL|nr:Nitric Oxide Synthase 2b [Nautilus pompilius]
MVFDSTKSTSLNMSQQEQAPVSRCPFSQSRFVKLKNYMKNTEHIDTLHQKAFTANKCNSQRCFGSVVPRTPSKREEMRSKEELLKQAADLMDQYYSSINKQGTKEHEGRLQEIADSVNRTGTYDPTSAELQFGARTAWRNASRCIGRMHWHTLKLFDARHVRTAQEMFLHICELMHYSNNNGNLRAAITIFPHNRDNKNYYRVWNAQLVRYAGYRQPDGSVIGDQNAVEFTEVCQKLGWKGKNGWFDVLPLVLSANGEDPEMFEIPPELVLEVNLEHPQYPWFADLKLKWYGVAFVSALTFDCGGLEFTAAPFSGWLTETEVGQRNLCERYKMTEVIARKMGLDTKKSTNLWKDRVATEVNLAVIHSYHSQKITLTDHHAINEAFMQFWENENRVRGGCPSDWVWIVPPASSSLTLTFHQEMLNYYLKPSLDYQPNEWTIHEWKKPCNKAIFENEKGRKVAFSVLAKAVLFSSMAFRKILKKRVKCTVLYATETGTAERFSRNLCKRFQQAFNTKMICMNEYEVKSLPSESLLLVVASTFGSGQPPENGKNFASKLEETQLTESKNLKNRELLRGVRYSVFGLGNSSYPDFCSFAHFVNDQLKVSGGEEINPIGEGDELSGQEEEFNTWTSNVMKAACKKFSLDNYICDSDSTMALTSDSTWSPDLYQVTAAPEVKESDLSSVLSDVHHKKVMSCVVLGNKQLQSSDSSRETVLVRLGTKNTEEMTYQAGDHIGIYPANQADIVDNILLRVDGEINPDVPVCIEVKNKEDNGEKTVRIPYSRLPTCSLRTALTSLLDVTTPPTKRLLERLANLATEQTDRDRLHKLATDKQFYESWKKYNFSHLAEVLQEFKSVKLTASFLLTQLPLMQQRFYSISSSADLKPGEIHVTVAVVNYRTKAGKGPLHHGVCSTWLNQCPIGQRVPCFIKEAPSFHLPKDDAAPVIMVGPGTGIAPFRSFWQQREVIRKSTVDSNKLPYYTLYFGCRQKTVDHIYRAELESAERTGALTNVHVAFSRQPGQQKTYVQDLILRDAKSVYRTLARQNGHIYICGDVSMATDVSEMLEEVFMQCCESGREDAKSFIHHLRSSGRYHEDIFGVKQQCLSSLPESEKERERLPFPQTKDLECMEDSEQINCEFSNDFAFERGV